jgi:hypothetical protein
MVTKAWNAETPAGGDCSWEVALLLLGYHAIDSLIRLNQTSVG